MALILLALPKRHSMRGLSMEHWLRNRQSAIFSHRLLRRAARPNALCGFMFNITEAGRLRSNRRRVGLPRSEFRPDRQSAAAHLSTSE